MFKATMYRMGLAALLAMGWCAAQETVTWDPSGATAMPGGSTGGNFYDYAPGAVLHEGVEHIFYCSNLDSGDVVDHIALTQIQHGDGALLVGKEIVLAPGVVETDAWRHIAGVWDGTAGTLTLYVDGIQAGQSTDVGAPDLKAFGGFRVVGGTLNPAARNTFTGRIDEVRVSKTARNIAASSAWQSPYAVDADTVDLYHFDSATDPAGNTRFFDAAAPQQDGYYFDFAAPAQDLHVASLAGFGECPYLGNSTGTGARGELFPDSPAHDVITNRLTVEAWINPENLSGTQTIFDSISARLDLIGGDVHFTVFFSDNSSLNVSADAGFSTDTPWDAYHVCDPSVVRGAFDYDGETYSWAMFYLGVDVPDVTHNQVGVAFSHDLAGPWVKWEGNPVAEYSGYDNWGVGQPSVTSIDGAGRMLLLYTRGDPATRIVRRELDFTNMSAPVIGGEVAVPTSGLTSGNGSPVVFHNADFAYDPSRDVFYVTRPRHPFDSDTPNFVSSELQIAFLPGAAMWSGVGAWSVLGHIDATNSGKARNHNSGFLHDPYGGIIDPDALTVYFCASDEGANWLWTYRLHRLTGVLSGFDDTPPVISLNGPAEITLALHDVFLDPVTAWDETDGDVTSEIVISGDTLDTSVAGAYVRVYNVSDSAGNAAEEESRTIVVNDDLDEDGLSDYWENRYFGNLDQGPDDDPDADDKTNAQEQADGTNPTDPASRLPASSGFTVFVLLLALAVCAARNMRSRPQ